MGVTVEDFEKRAIQLDRPFIALDGMGRNVWVVPVTFSAERYINYTRYLTGDHEIRLSRTEKARTANAKFDINGYILSPQEFSDFTIMSITATNNISGGD